MIVSTAMPCVRAFWTAMFWRLTPGRSRSVRTIAPIIATSSIEAGELEEEDVVRVEHAPERLGVGDGLAAGGIAERGLHQAGIDRPGADDEDQLDQEDRADEAAHRQVLLEALPQLREVDVEHHDDEQEQHRDGADIDHDEDHRQELGAHQDEEPGGVHEGQDQEQHRGHGIARSDHHEARGDGEPGEQVEEGGGCSHSIRGSAAHAGPFCRYVSPGRQPPVYRTRCCEAQPVPAARGEWGAAHWHASYGRS